jgi:hypothetical protein
MSDKGSQIRGNTHKASETILLRSFGCNPSRLIIVVGTPMDFNLLAEQNIAWSSVTSFDLYVPTKKRQLD